MPSASCLRRSPAPPGRPGASRRRRPAARRTAECPARAASARTPGRTPPAASCRAIRRPRRPRSCSPAAFRSASLSLSYGAPRGGCAESSRRPGPTGAARAGRPAPRRRFVTHGPRRPRGWRGGRRLHRRHPGFGGRVGDGIHSLGSGRGWAWPVTATSIPDRSPKTERSCAKYEGKQPHDPLYHLSRGQRGPRAAKAATIKKPAGPLYHLSHGQRGPVGFGSLSLPEQNARSHCKPWANPRSFPVAPFP